MNLSNYQRIARMFDAAAGSTGHGPDPHEPPFRFGPAPVPASATADAAAAAAAVAATAASAPTSLDIPESNAHPCREWHGSWAHRQHSGWTDRRVLTYDLLASNGTGESSLKRFANCGAGAFVYRHRDHPDLVRIVADHCRNRFCLVCQRARGSIIARNLETLAATAGHRLSLITFTLKHSTAPLREQLDILTSCFRELRRLRIWKAEVAGAAWTIECKIGQDGLWHPHLHVLADAGYMSHSWLSKAWHTTTGTSTVVDVRRVSAKHGARYIAKYVKKPLDSSLYEQPDRMAEYMVAVKGKRTTAALGSWRKLPLAERPDDEDDLASNVDMSPANFVMVGDYDALLRDASANVPAAVRDLNLIWYGSIDGPAPPNTG